MNPRLFLLAILFSASTSLAQEQIDQADVAKRGKVPTKDVTFRARVVKAAGGDAFSLSWKRGGQGLGGLVYTGPIPAADGAASLGLGVWSKRVPIDEIVGKGDWSFPNILVDIPGKKGKKAGLTQVVVEMEFADKDVPFKSFTESAPDGSTVTFAFPGAAADRKTFEAELLPLSRYVRARYDRLAKAFAVDDPLPTKFAILGHHGGYGTGAGYAIRHNDPAIAADESKSLRLLGFNGMVHKQPLATVDAAGFGKDFRVGFIGGPGAGSPMNYFKKQKVEDACPFDPGLRKSMLAMVRKEIADEYKIVGAKEAWAEWWDEIGVAAKEHIQTCPRCREQYEAYVRANGVSAADVGFADGAVRPYPLWRVGEDKKKVTLVPPPATASATGSRNWYWSYRFMTYATGQLFPESAAELKKAAVPLFAMQGPTPSWNGSSLDWFEFYDQKANTAVVWETSNRDPRTWQFESYLADIARGIARRLGLLIGTLVKPHRGAPEQRLMATVSRGATTIEWYNYGPDYARGDSFSQRPDLLLRVGRANRLLAKVEDRLYGAKWAGQPEVAFVSPRSSEIWGKATDLDVTAFENAKWVYLALQHAHIPVDILSEQQLAEGKLDRYKAIYVPGTHLHHDASARLKTWVEAGGLLWTDALGLSRDEANQPTTAIAGLMKLGERRLESWGSVPGYRATTLEPLVEKMSPKQAAVAIEASRTVARIGREVFGEPGDGGPKVQFRFADGKPAVLRQHFGHGEIVVVGWWAGLTYSAKVRRSDFDMRTDFDSDDRLWIVGPIENRGCYAPVKPSAATVEAVMLDKDGQRSIVLMNWAYKASPGRYGGVLEPESTLRIGLPGVGEFRTVRSVLHGTLPIEGTGRAVILPALDEVDVLILD
jgi:hypothetical protein